MELSPKFYETASLMELQLIAAIGTDLEVQRAKQEMEARDESNKVGLEPGPVDESEFID